MTKIIWTSTQTSVRGVLELCLFCWMNPFRNCNLLVGKNCTFLNCEKVQFIVPILYLLRDERNWQSISGYSPVYHTCCLNYSTGMLPTKTANDNEMIRDISPRGNVIENIPVDRVVLPKHKINVNGWVKCVVYQTKNNSDNNTEHTSFFAIFFIFYFLLKLKKKDI